MTEAEKNEIVGLVMTEISSQAVDFDITTEQPQANDLLTAVRKIPSGEYKGVTLKWDDVARIATELANQAATRAEQALSDTTATKTEVGNMKASVEQTVTDFNALAEEKKQEVQGVYQNDLDELKGDLTNSKKAIVELDDKKITKFYASNNGNTNLPDSDNGKPSDMKIFGKSVQDGTPSPDAPIEIQSVVNPKLSVCGVNVFDYEKYITSSSYKESGYTVRNYQLEPNTKYYFKIIVRKSNGSVGIWLLQPNDSTINGENFIGLTTNYPLIESFTTKQDGIIKIGCMNVVYENYLKDNLIISTNEIVTSVFVPFKGYQTATLPYILNAIPVTSGGNVTIDGQLYIADYVDIENKQLVRMTKLVDMYLLNWSMTTDGGINYFHCLQNDMSFGRFAICTDYLYKNVVFSQLNNKQIVCGDNTFSSAPNIIVRDDDYNSATDFKNSLSGAKLLYELATPTEEPLTDEEVQAFKDLATYYPITNVITTSDKLDGYTTFNYPLNMANGWNYVMQQIGETRPIIYDTQVKTIENLIDTAILTAMMEA